MSSSDSASPGAMSPIRAARAAMWLLPYCAAALCIHATAADGGPTSEERQRLERAWECQPYVFGSPFTVMQIRLGSPDCREPKMPYPEQDALLDALKQSLGEKQVSTLGRWLRGESIAIFQSEEQKKEEHRKRQSKSDDPAVLRAFQDEKARRDLAAAERARREQLEAERKRQEQQAEYEKSPEYRQKLLEQQERDRQEREQLAKEAEERERAAAAARAKEEGQKAALEERMHAIRSGKARPSNFAEVQLAYGTAASLNGIMISPLLDPDGGYYSGKILIDGRKPGFIQGKILYGLARDPGIAYVYLRTTARTVNFVPAKMRIGERVSVLGRYVQNATYRTVLGEERTAPVIEVMYVGE